GLGRRLQYAGEHAEVGVAVDEPPGARDRDVIGRVLVECDRQELSQRKRIGEAPGDAALTVESFEEADHHDPEILAWRQGWSSQSVVIKAATVCFAEKVELGIVEYFVKPLIEGVAWCCGQL